MLYIEETSFSRQIDTLKFLASIGSYEIILWLYPDTKIDLCNLELAPKDLIEGEQVTKYADSTIPHRTRRTKLTNELLNIIQSSADDIIKNCDSIALYLPDAKDWVACTIGHEGMTLVRDDDLFLELKTHGFSASDVKPDWW